MRIETRGEKHLDEWARLRAALWPDCAADAHRRELAETLASAAGRRIAFLARNDGGDAIGFAEAALRHDNVNGCETSPVVFLEGIYVRPAERRQGIAARLCEAVAVWGRILGCDEFASDAPLANTKSHEFHKAVGFQEREPVVFFRRLL
jgi:aminoglycoside 6'-N-acetyltransferase I